VENPFLGLKMGNYIVVLLSSNVFTQMKKATVFKFLKKSRFLKMEWSVSVVISMWLKNSRLMKLQKNVQKEA